MKVGGQSVSVTQEFEGISICPSYSNNMQNILTVKI